MITARVCRDCRASYTYGPEHRDDEGDDILCPACLFGTPECRTPLIDQWMRKWPARQSDSVSIESRFPETLWVHEIDDGWVRVKLGPTTFTHKAEDMRLLLAAAIEWLDIRIEDDAEIERHRHSHFCRSCSNLMSKGTGCNNCRDTGFDQTPCVGCPGGPTS